MQALACSWRAQAARLRAIFAIVSSALGATHERTAVRVLSRVWPTFCQRLLLRCVCAAYWY